MNTLRSIFLISCIGLLNHAFGQIPNYFENQSAICMELYNSDGGGSDAYTEDAVYRFNENDEMPDYFHTTRTYHRYYTLTGESEEGVQNAGYVRQEGRAIYFLDIATGSDSLFIDYDLSVGDTIKGFFGEVNPNTVVQHIDSVLVGDAYRLLLYTDTLYPENTIHLIEGIGYLNNGGYTGNYFGEGAYYGMDGLGFDFMLNAYGEDLDVLWFNGEGEPTDHCNLYLTVDENATEQPFLTCFPNPTKGHLRIETNDRVSQIQIFNLDWQVQSVHSTEVTNNTQEFDLSRLSAGIYIVQIVFENGQVQNEKIVLQ